MTLNHTYEAVVIHVRGFFFVGLVAFIDSVLVWKVLQRERERERMEDMQQRVMDHELSLQPLQDCSLSIRATGLNHRATLLPHIRGF